MGLAFNIQEYIFSKKPRLDAPAHEERAGHGRRAASRAELAQQPVLHLRRCVRVGLFFF